MNEQTASGNSRQAQAEEPRQPWVTPTFERIELKEALSGGGESFLDADFYNS